MPPARPLLLLGAPGIADHTMARALRLLRPLEVGILQDTITPAEPPAVLVISGVRLSDDATIRLARRGLAPFLQQTIPVLWLLEDPSAREGVQARAVGATAVLPPQVSPRRVRDAIEALLQVSPTQRRAGARAVSAASVQDVGLVLADLLDAASTTRTVDRQASGEAASALLQAIGQGGIEQWLTAVAAIDDRTYRHCLLMAGLTAAFVKTIGLAADDCDRITRAALLHDVGKALVPIELMNKQGRLTLDEMAVIRRHAELGHELLLAQGDHDQTTLDIALHHHEYLDGTGYPHGLSGAEISDEVRIATICDVFTALIEARPYKQSLSASEADALMRPMSGKLDPHLLRVFRRVFVPQRAPHRADA